jgi:DNA-binding CsgD family transcriptional regulator
VRAGAEDRKPWAEANDGGRETGLYERDAEVAALTQALHDARGGTGRLLVVEGPAGIGKSRLLAEARTMAGALGMAVLTACGVDLERGAPFGVAAGLFTAAAGAAVPEGGRDGLLSGRAALAASLFNPAAAPPAEPLTLVHGLYWVTVNLAAGSPAGVLIAVDDAQWADEPSLSYLAYLAVRIDELPAVLVITTRSGEPTAAGQTLGWLRGRPGCQVLRPQALSAATVEAMVRAELPTAETAFSLACAEVTGGNPFLVGELLRALRANGIEPTAGAAARVRSLVPDSVLHSVLVRLARFGAPALRLARAVAVLGDRGTLRQARLLADLGAEQAERAADTLADAHILASGEPLRFTHPLIAASVYADIPAFARARAHRQAADLLAAEGAPPDAVAAHLLLTRPDGQQQTVQALREAAVRALAKGDPAAAVKLLTRALAEPPTLASRGEVLLELADAELVHGGMGAAPHIEEALRLLDAPADQARALAALSRLRFHLGEHEQSVAALSDALSLLKPSDPALTPLLVGYLTATMFREALYPLGTERLLPLLDAARDGRPPADPGLLAHLVLRLAFAAAPAGQVRALAVRATAADPLIDPGSMGVLTALITQALCCVDELDAAEGVSAAALAAAQRRGSLHSFCMSSYQRAVVRFHRGELTEALADLDQSLASSREGWTTGIQWIGGLYVHIHVERGDLAAARDALALTDGAAPSSMDLPIALFAKATLALAERRPETALADAEAAGRILADGFGIDHPGFVPWQRTAARAAAALGQVSRAKELADALLERARWSGTARALGLALGTQAAVIGGTPGIALLAEAVQVLERSPSVLERAHALVALGAARRRARQRSAAAAPLRAGLQLADAMGATRLTETARHELQALGLRPRRAAVTGPDSLTPTERRVADLAASGLTNRQIAEALFVTVKTVETHLARVYTKLGIASRADLARRIAPLGRRPAP